MNPFLNSEGQLRSGWWVLFFFLVLTVLLVPTSSVVQRDNLEVSFSLQAASVAVTSLICQWLRRKSLTELLGKFDRRWLKELGLGIGLGAALMLIPAFILRIFGWIDWQWNPISLTTIASSVWLFVSVAIAEELLFRGFIFQRFIAGLGQWPAQLIVAGVFLLTHVNNPGMTGNIKALASANIFLASLIFGLAFLRTRGLALPLGLHFMANWTQGGLLGLGVSGTGQVGLLKPVLRGGPEWLTGGSFGLEASVVGLMCVVVMLILLCKWKPPQETSDERQTVISYP